MTDYRLFSGTSGPSSGVSFGGVTVQGLLFQVTSPDLWIKGYSIWGPATNPLSGNADFAMWAANGSEAGLICSAAAQVTSGALVAGWNDTLLPLATVSTPGVWYKAVYDLTGNFPTTNGQFASGGVYAAGIIAGPLTAASNATGSAPDPWNDPQATVFTSGTAATVYPTGAGGTAGFNPWIDVILTDVAPTTGTFWPFANFPAVGQYTSSESLAGTLGWDHSTVGACPALRCWHYSMPGSTALPSWAGIWDTTTTATVWVNPSPAWSGIAGSGWVSTPVTGFTSVSGRHYRGSTFLNAAGVWFGAFPGYYSTGPGSAGFTIGPVVVPTTASVWNSGGGGPVYPNTALTESDFSGIIEYGPPVAAPVSPLPVLYSMRSS